MSIVTTRIRVSADGGLTTAEPLPPGEHAAAITIVDKPRPGIRDLPTHAGDWDDSRMLGRAEIYADDEP